VLEELKGSKIRRVLWASFGDVLESWFVAYELKNGVIALRLGGDAPAALRTYIDHVSEHKHLLGSLRVQLGPNGSFVVWSNTSWACYNVPVPIRARLCELSSASRENNGVTMGSILKGPLMNVQWHQDGTFYIRRINTHNSIFKTTLMHEAWRNLLPGVDHCEINPSTMVRLL
jgi:methylenetetrahydrofolate dehydrogenase (NADP+)/methenyltetrahydrofolate cyclohydrolase/formyltetrahydrofolate synthetase